MQNNYQKSPLWVALDLDDANKALDLAKSISPFVGGFKIGPRLCLRYGAEFIQKISQWGPVFIDQKYFDIPHTMLQSVQSSFDVGATFVTVHALAGTKALSQLAQLEKKLSEERPFKILVVTVLTSFNEKNSLPLVPETLSIEQQVHSLVRLAVGCGLSGLVCSPLEVKFLRKRYPQLFIVTPGIRLPENDLHDQQRVMTPQNAIQDGADALVVGRPIVEAQDPFVAASDFAEAIKATLTKRA